MDRLDAMTVFLSVVETGSLSAAGRLRGMPLATVSRKLAELETHLGARLLNRSTRKLALTDAGADYVEACKRILGEVDAAERAAGGEYDTPRGDLVITAPLAFGRLHVLPVVDAFLIDYPMVDVRLVLGDRISRLIDEHVDVAVRIGVLPDSRLNATRLGDLRRVVCASPAYLAAHGRPRRPADLAGHRCITFDAMSSPDTWHFADGGAQTAVPVHSRLVVNTAEAAVDAAVAGLGVTRVLAYQAAQARRAKQVVVLLEKFEPEKAPVHLVFDGQQRIALKLRAFLDYAAPRLRDSLRAL